MKFSRREAGGLLLLTCAVAFNAFFLAPELRIGTLPPNDAVFHLTAAERLGNSLATGEPLLDPWVSEWSLGYPVWRSYQPLPHLAAAVVLRLTRPWADSASAFAALQYFLLVLLPASVYVGARLFGLQPVAGGLSAILVLMPAGTGELGRYGLGYGATTWRGSGLFTQLVAIHSLVVTLGLVVRALDSGRQRTLASVGLATTALSHIVFGYVAFLSAAVCALVGPSTARARRIARLPAVVLPAVFLLAWFAVPLFITRGEINHSRWEAAYKWDSFGAQYILSELWSGRLLDGNRIPVLSFLVGIGALVAIRSRCDAVSRRLLALTTLWLALFFGRATWGHLLLLLGIPGNLHIHRFQAAFELTVVLTAAWGTERLLRAATARGRAVGLAVGVCVAAGLAALGTDRARFLRENALWGEQNLAAYAAEQSDLESALATVRRILAERPGRVSAGKAASWGGQFKVGSVPVYAFLTRSHMDQVSFLYHSMSLTSDVMVLRDGADAAHDVAFGVRAVVAPADMPMLAHLRRRAVHGRFAVYESSREGYFGLVDVGAQYVGSAETNYEPSTAWLRSPWLRAGVVMSLGKHVPGLAAVDRWEPLPAAPPAMLTPRGRILEEIKDGETYRARLSLRRACYVFVKLTWYPDLVATVDGRRALLLRVTPGFGAVPVLPGEHTVEVSYRPGPLKPLLLAGGMLLFVLSVYGLGLQRAQALEEGAAVRLASAAQRAARPQVKTAVALVALSLLALRPLFRGLLIDGHDALEYPPRLVEFGRAIRDGHIPPVWAPDLSAGHGQPLFEFAPPLLYVAAYPFHVVGCRLADSLQLALACLFLASAVAVYRLGRRMPASRAASLCGATAWMFAPYVSLDLYVRAAFAEAAALAVFPVALLGVVVAIDRPSALRIALGSVAVALVPLAHNGAALLILPALAVIAATRWRWAALASGVSVILGGLGLSAYFWVPALMERDFVKTHLLREDFLHWSWHAISPWQLLWSPWGYGLSVPGTADGMSFQLGIVHLALAVTGFVLIWRTRDRTRRVEALAFAALALSGAWLTTTWSAPLWSRIEMLQYLAFPWRALMLPGLFLSLLAVATFEKIGHRGRLCGLGILVAANLAHTTPKGYLTFDDEYFSPTSIARRGLNTTTREEYEPRWVEVRPPYTADRLLGHGGKIKVLKQSVGSDRQEFLVEASTGLLAEASTFYYPGWQVYVDGEAVRARPTAERGTMSFPVPRGSHTVVMKLESTVARGAGAFLTFGTVLLLISYFSVVLCRHL